jgi:hypothetical protein
VLTYNPPINVVNNSQEQQIRYESPKISEPGNIGYSGFDFLNTASTTPTTNYSTPTSIVSPTKPVQWKKPVSIQSAADDFFSGITDEPKPSSPTKQIFKGPVAKAAATANLIAQPPPLQINNNFSNGPYGVPINITMNTGGTADPFAELESELKSNTVQPSMMTQPNYQDLELLSGVSANQPPKLAIKKPIQPTTNVTGINNNNFFDLL